MAEDPKERRKKKAADDDGQKSVTGLSLKLNELEHTLRMGYDRMDKPPSQENQRRRGAGAARGARVAGQSTGPQKRVGVAPR
jgi:hypothetical protein